MAQTLHNLLKTLHVLINLLSIVYSEYSLNLFKNVNNNKDNKDYQQVRGMFCMNTRSL